MPDHDGERVVGVLERGGGLGGRWAENGMAELVRVRETRGGYGLEDVRLGKDDKGGYGGWEEEAREETVSLHRADQQPRSDYVKVL